MNIMEENQTINGKICKKVSEIFKHGTQST